MASGLLALAPVLVLASSLNLLCLSSSLAGVKIVVSLNCRLHFKVVVFKRLLYQRFLEGYVNPGDRRLRVSELRQFIPQVLDLFLDRPRLAVDNVGLLTIVGIHDYDRQPLVVDSIVYFFSKCLSPDISSERLIKPSFLL